MTDALPIRWVDGAHRGRIRQRLRRAPARPFLTLWRIGDELWLGPLHRAGAPGCLLCLWERLHRASHDRALFLAQAELERGSVDPFAILPTQRLAIEYLVQQESERLASGGAPLTREGVYRLSLKTGEVALHPLVPVPDCPHCGVSEPRRRPLRAQHRSGEPYPRIERRAHAHLHELLRPQPKADPHQFRGAAEPPNLLRLRRRFVDVRTGLILNELHHERPGPVRVAESKLILADRTEREPGLGRALTWAAAETAALLEALERHAGLERCAPPPVTASAAQLGDLAIDPRTLLLHHPSAYTGSLVPYSEGLVTDWVWAHSFAHGARLLPEQAVTYGHLPGPRFLIETSSGCALGRSLPEAAFHALLELIERDALLLTWHGALPVPPIDLRDCPDPQVRVIIDALTAQGLAVHAYRTTTDIDLPAVLVLATIAGRPFVCATGAHPDPVKALLGGLVELTVAAQDLRADWDSFRPQGAPQPDRVRSVADHIRFHWHPDCQEAWSFLLAERPKLAWQEAFPERWPRHTDLQRDLRLLVQRVAAAGLDVIIADQTPPALAQEGLHVVRAVVPGALPLAFGHLRRRIEGAPRLLEAPARMGYGPVGLRNPLPHPFG